LEVIREERDRNREESSNLEDLTSIGGGLLTVIPETQEGHGRGKRGVLLEDGQVLSDSEGNGDTTFPRGGGGSRLDMRGADVSSTAGWKEEAGESGMASFMDVSSPRITPAGYPPRHETGGAGTILPADTEEAAEEEAEGDCKGMEYDTDLAEDVYYYILEAPQPWTVGRIFRAAIKKFTGTDRASLHATIVATLVTMRKTAQHVLMSSIRAGPPSPNDPAIPVYMDLSQVEFYQGGQSL